MSADRHPVRRTLSLLATLAAATGLFAGPLTAAADPPLEEQLAWARADRGAAEAGLDDLERRLTALSLEYRLVQKDLDATTVELLTSYRSSSAISARLHDAQARLDARIRAAYQMGPGLTVEFLLGARSLEDLAWMSEFAARSIGLGAGGVREVQALRRSLEGVTMRLERRQFELAAGVARLEALAKEIEGELAQGRALVASSRADVERLEARKRDLERRQREVEEVRTTAEASLTALVDPGRGVDQSDLLALLGPNEGRGCAIPEGLEMTDLRIEGISSWYGWELAGQPTASGAIFDPLLFTAANKELPLGVFLRVHYNGRCAIVLVNDRGPYHPGWVLDLSMAAADHLGLGLGHVTAEVLVPA
jgi:peptidoglycan hydrolase CwlO-like protein